MAIAVLLVAVINTMGFSRQCVDRFLSVTPMKIHTLLLRYCGSEYIYV